MHFRPGPTRGGRKRETHGYRPRSAGLGKAEAVALLGSRAAGRLGLRVWLPLLLSGCSVPNHRTGARSAAILAAPAGLPGRMAAALQL